ncbi:MAG: gliding motility-associated C-terminal domain-containing protein [Cyclobacteriaceae bacterium]|nr:gliding motility-associated C-terminal domain-containing protein [Cyclobacteriaceae bacterium]
MNARWYVLLIIVSLFFTKQASGQYLSVGGDFELDQQLGCSDLTVTVTNLNPGICATPPCPIAYKYEGINSATTLDAFYTYTVPGSYWVYQFIQGATGDRADSILMTVVAPELPNITLFSCNSLGLLVQINDTYYDEYEINYGDGSVIIVPKGSTVLPYTYANNNQRTVNVTGLFTTATNQCGVTSIPFDPLATVLPAQIDSLIQLNGSTLKLNYNLPANSDNKLEISIGDNTNFVLFKNLNQNTSVDTIASLSLPQNTYCFRIATYDACSNFRSYSNEICSITLNASAQNNQITTDWNTVDFGVAQSFNLFRDDILLQSLASTVFQHVDTTVICNTNYCYQLDVNYAGGISRSLKVCETAFSTDIPPTIDNISSTTNSDSIEWVWQVPLNSTPENYIVHQTLENGSIISSETANTNSLNQLFENQTNYISVQMVDICGNVSPLNLIASSIFLEGDINGNLDIELSWNDYFGWIDGHQGFYITIRSEEGDLIDSVYTGGNTSFTVALEDQEKQTLTFTVWVIPVLDGIPYSRSNMLTLERDPVIAIPNSFTPNGDGLNDKFIVTGKFIESYEMQIFNRWGEVLYQTTDLENGWDGTSRNKKIGTGNYSYWVRIKDLNNNEHIRTGSILILSN